MEKQHYMHYDDGSGTYHWIPTDRLRPDGPDLILADGFESYIIKDAYVVSNTRISIHPSGLITIKNSGKSLFEVLK